MRRQTITSCSNRACIPSKILLRPAEAVDGASNAAATGQVDNEAALAWRDHTVSNDSDAGQERRLAEHEIDLRRGRGRLVGPGVLDADGVRCTTGHVVVATVPSRSSRPVPGLWGLESIRTTSACAPTPVPARQPRWETRRGFSLKGRNGEYHR